MNTPRSAGEALAWIVYAVVLVCVLQVRLPSLTHLPAPPSDAAHAVLLPPTPGEQAETALARGERLKTVRELELEELLRTFPDVRDYLDEREQAIVFGRNSAGQDIEFMQCVYLARDRKLHASTTPKWRKGGVDTPGK